MKRQDCAYLAVMHPTRGVMVYSASPQGLKNSSEFSYDRLGRVFGKMVEDARLTRMADGLYPLGDTPEELLENFIAMLALAEEAGFTFQPAKTWIAPRKTIIFGWELEEGCWSPQSHVISSLSRSKKPVTVKQLRSYLGSVKQLSDCLPGHSILPSPFERLLDQESLLTGLHGLLSWTWPLQRSRRRLLNLTVSYVPLPSDKLIT